MLALMSKFLKCGAKMYHLKGMQHTKPSENLGVTGPSYIYAVRAANQLEGEEDVCQTLGWK